MLRYLAICLALIATTFTGAQAAEKSAPKEITIYAAASLREALTEVIKNYEASSAQKVNLKFGPSHELAKELATGATANLFISDHEDEIKRLGQHNKTLKGTRATMLSNTLALVAHTEFAGTLSSAALLADLPLRTLAVPDPAVTAVGKYAQTYLTSLPKGKTTVWDSLQKRLKPTPDPAKAIGADKNTVGILYTTDAKQAKNVKILLEIPAAEFKTFYSLVMLQAKNHGPHVQDLFNYLQSKKSKEVFARHGFGTPRASEGRSRPGPTRKGPTPETPKAGAKAPRKP